MGVSKANQPSANPSGGLIDAPHVDGPSGPHADELMLFGRFIGSWTLEWCGGKSARASGELHFGWVLGGRAIQDI
jgi:hypothetical protein